MKSYPYDKNQSYPRGRCHQQYLKTYNTRKVAPDKFHKLRNGRGTDARILPALGAAGVHARKRRRTMATCWDSLFHDEGSISGDVMECGDFVAGPLHRHHWVGVCPETECNRQLNLRAIPGSGFHLRDLHDSDLCADSILVAFQTDRFQAKVGTVPASFRNKCAGPPFVETRASRSPSLSMSPGASADDWFEGH